MINSIVEKRNAVTFPVFASERIYMHPFYKQSGLPNEYRHWQTTVDNMLIGVDTDKPIYLMVDQAFVKGNQTHRRPGLHVDGYWIVSGHGGGSHLGDCPPRWQGGGGSHSSSKNGWGFIDFSAPEAIILASDVKACAAYSGLYDEQLIGDGGDASNIKGNFEKIDMEANYAYVGNVGMLHESLPVNEDCFRTLVRLNVPGWSPLLVN